MKTECACSKCVGCCKNNQPGWFMPGEAEAAAAWLGVSFDEFKARLIRDFRCEEKDNDETPVFVYRPRMMHEDGDTAAFWTGRGRCVFLDDNDRCSIYPARPLECAETLSCSEQKVEEMRDLRGRIAHAWREAGSPLGSEVPEPTFGDVFEFLLGSVAQDFGLSDEEEP